MLVAGLHDVGHEDVAAGRGAFSLRSLNKALQLFISIQLQRLEAQDISMTCGGLHDVGHKDVTSRRGAFSLCSLISASLRAPVLCSSLLGEPPQLFNSI